MHRKFTVLSAALNIVLVGTFVIYLYSNGGINCSHKKLQPQEVASSDYRTPHKDKKVMQRASLFQLLPDTDGEIIFLGDSFTSGGRWNEFFQNEHVKNRGIPGDRTDLMINRLAEVGQSRPRKIFIMVGFNDLNRGRTVHATITDYRYIIKTLTSLTPDTEIFVQSVLPINRNIRNVIAGSRRLTSNSDILALNTLLKSLAQEYKLTYIDLYSILVDDNNQLNPRYTDTGSHLNGQGYLIWMAAIKPHIDE